MDQSYTGHSSDDQYQCQFLYSHDGLMGQSTKASVNIDVDLPTNCPIVPRRTNPPRSQCSPMRRAAHAYSMLGQSTAELSCPDLLSAAMILLIRCSVHIMGTFCGYGDEMWGDSAAIPRLERISTRHKGAGRWVTARPTAAHRGSKRVPLAVSRAHPGHR
ncbi:hypothetical protein SNOG_03676 [Parastagonospora nodorum SN15]|uniref:Uncharacterized protein n=1 Tax=Phaeosphaeria nodorum (strain SN15 / ATCC MYA-4574 / FGSC 10173) TaxID=321614 RepID=Q0UX38_PHANO|nr:hypothetical protein SNOG_03676 [Parastagonospora nodorum SN15]EAT88881.1 hypothetical protein SNOG_03676 [Parastagonospora nodorum SN15]